MSTEDHGAIGRAGYESQTQLASNLFEHLRGTLKGSADGQSVWLPDNASFSQKLRSRLFEAYIRNTAYELFKTIPSRQVVRNITDQLEAHFLIQGQNRQERAQ